MTSALLVTALPLGLVALVGGGWVVLLLLPTRNGLLRNRPPSAARRLTWTLTLSLAAAVLVDGVLTAARGGASFATAGAQRYVTAPVVYGAFALVAVATIRHFTRSWPVWVIGLLTVTFVSTLTSPLAGPRFTLGSLLQGLVLFGGAALFASCGLLEAEWHVGQRRRLLQLLLGVGAAAGLLGLGTGIFSALALPSAAILIYLVRERSRFWPALAAVGLAVVAVSVLANSGAVDPSAASTGQLVVSGAVLALAAVPLRLRPALVVVGVAAGALLLIGSDVPGLVLGIGADLKDVTLAQRAYETQQVVNQADGNPVVLLFGAGPGATVDLTNSPDALTLAASGRVLSAVPSVHLLSTYVLLKAGLLGLIWLGVFLFAVVKHAYLTLRPRHVDLFDLALTVLVIAGVVQAIPAGTFLLSNPLPMLLLAVLTVRHREPAIEPALSTSTIGRRVIGP